MSSPRVEKKYIYIQERKEVQKERKLVKKRKEKKRKQRRE